ncbi:MAG: prepilin peptidase [Pirellulales bacterium]
MSLAERFAADFAEHWPIWLVTITLVVAAWIDGVKLKVPNWLTFPMIVSGWVYSGLFFGWEGIGWSLVGTVVGLALLLPAYAIGGMGAGDVKLLAGVGAWTGAIDLKVIVYAFCVSAIVGAVLAVLMVLWSGRWRHHLAQLQVIAGEIITIRDPEALSTIAAERKPRMMLLPYGIPIALGTIGYFAWSGMLI